MAWRDNRIAVGSATMMRMRTIAGFLIAPLVPVALIAATLMAVGAIDDDVRDLLFAAVVLANAIALAIGLPLFILMRRVGWNGFAAYVIAGAALGGALYVALPALIDVLISLQGV